MKEIINTNKAPQAIGPYSQAVKINGFVFTSGQIPVCPETGEVASDIQAQAKQALENLKEVLKEAGADMDKVIKTTVFIKDMNDFAAINEIYAQYFTDNYPSRACVQVARLPKDVGIEVEAIAVL